jgi:hypothetical protein
MKRYFYIICICLLFVGNQALAQEKTGLDSTNLIQSFNLLRSGASVKILWQTASEKNNNFFEVQKSTDGVTFKVVALVFAREDAAGGADYQYIDQTVGQLASEYVYYRIRQVDMQQNGIFTRVRKFRVSEFR